MKTVYAYNSLDSAGAGSPAFQEIGMPPMFTPGGKGVKPIAVNLYICDDATGSGAAWAKGIEVMTKALTIELEAKFAQVKYSYIGMRDQDIGERDEVRLKNGTAEELLREQKLLRREGGGDAAETFFQTVEDLLNDPSFAVDTGHSEARGLVLKTTSDSKPARENSVQDLGRELKSRRIHLYVVGTPGSNMQELVDAAQGDFFPLDVNPSTAEAQRMASALAATVAATVSAGGTAREPGKTVRATVPAMPSGTVSAGTRPKP